MREDLLVEITINTSTHDHIKTRKQLFDILETLIFNEEELDEMYELWDIDEHEYNKYKTKLFKFAQEAIWNVNTTKSK